MRRSLTKVSRVSNKCYLRQSFSVISAATPTSYNRSYASGKGFFFKNLNCYLFK